MSTENRQPKLETWMNAAVAVAAVVFLSTWGSAAIKEISNPVVPPIEIHKPGDPAPQLAGLSYRDTQRTFLIFVNSTCRFCSLKMPLYRDLMKWRHPANRIVAMSWEPLEILQEFLSRHSFSPDVTLRLPPSADKKLRSVPTVLEVNNQGVIVQVWTGTTTPGQEDALRAASAR